MLLIAPEVRDAMFAHALACLPHEACGMLSAGDAGDVVDVFHAMTNVAASASLFALDGQEQLDLETQIDAAGRALVAVMHSHTQTSPYPSPTDLADIGRFDPGGHFHHLIVSLRHAEPVLRSYLVVDGVVAEELVVVAEPEPDVHDQAGAVAAVARLPRPEA